MPEPGESDGAERALLVLLAAIALAGALAASQSSGGLDYHQFWAVGRALAGDGAADVYRDEGRRRIGARALEAARAGGPSPWLRTAERREVLETYSTPLLYAAIGLASTGRYATDLLALRLVLLAALAASVALWCRAAGGSRELAGLALLAFTVGFAPLQSDLRVGNVNAILLALASAAVALSARGGDAAAAGAGALLGTAVLFKPTLAFAALLLAVAWIASDRRRALGLAAAGAAGAAALALAWTAASFGTPAIWVEWARALAALPSDILRLEQGNAAPAPWLSAALGADASPLLLLALTGVVAHALWRARGAGAAAPGGVSPDALAVALGCLVPLLGARLAWLHYHVLAVPMLLVLLRPLPPGVARSASWRRVLALAALVAIARTPLRWIGLDLGPAALTALSAAALLALFAAGVAELHAIGRASR